MLQGPALLLSYQNSSKVRLIILFVCLVMILPISAQTQSEISDRYNTEAGLALQGYDVVAYFSMGKAVKGKAEIHHRVGGRLYYFSSQLHRDQFIANPAQYEPQYGGWCAYAMGETGEKVGINPETFKIAEGKLYLFYNAYFNNTLKKWNKDEKNLKRKADLHWQALIDH